MNQDIQALLLQGDQFLKSNQLQEAQNCYLNVLAQQSNISEAYFRLAWIANKQGQVLSARKNLKKAYDLQPNNKDYLFGLTQLYLQTSRVDDAIKCYRAYLQQDDSQDDVYFNFACLLAQTNQVNDALAAFNKCIQLNPSQLTYYMKLGELLYNLLRFPDALAVYYKALENQLYSEGLFLNIAKMHVDAGEADKAQTILKQAASVFPDSLVFAYRLSSLDKQSLTQDLLLHLKSQELDSLSEENQFYFYWLNALYAFQDDDLSSELNSLIKAHKIYQSLGRFAVTSEAFMARLAQLSQASSLINDARIEPVSDELSPIFIVGVPRCGSTLIENIICAGPQQVIKGEETSALFHALKQSTVEETINENALKQLIQGLYQKHQIAHDKQLFTDKSLENIFFIDLIIALYPKARIIYCDRAPLASIISILKNNMAVLPWAHDLESILNYVDKSLEAIALAQTKHSQNILHIKYENLVTEPEEESKKIMAFCGLSWDESCLAFHEKQGIVSRTASHLQIRSAINQNSLSAYKRYQTFFTDYEARYPWLKQ